MNRKIFSTTVFLTVLMLSGMLASCSNWEGIDWENFMSCPGSKANTQSDLHWIDFAATFATNPLPGDQVSIRIIVHNNGDPTATNPGPNIPYSSNLRLFLEDKAAATGVGTIGPEDWFIGEFVVPGLFADKMHVIVEPVTIPWTDHFPNVMPDPNNPPDLGPETVDFTLYGMLDSQDCIGEVDENNNLTDGTEVNAVDITVYNPYLPNLQIKFIDRTPASPLPQTGGTVITEWEILNAGIGLVSSQFDVSVYLSEDDIYDPWDQVVGQTTIDQEMLGNTNLLIYIFVSLPYTIWKNNTYDGEFSCITIYDPIVGPSGNNRVTRTPPPAGPPGYNFDVFPCIAGSSFLIAQVDSNPDPALNIREAVEIDNYSYQGTGGNGDIIADNFDTGSYDVECVELRCDMIQSALDSTIRYSSTLPWADQGSIGWYYSKNDDPQFGDYFIERFWYLLSPGNGINLDIIWTPNNAPAPGTYRVVVCLDDVFKWQESDEDNNWKLSTGTVNIQ